MALNGAQRFTSCCCEISEVLMSPNKHLKVISEGGGVLRKEHSSVL